MCDEDRRLREFRLNPDGDPIDDQETPSKEAEGASKAAHGQKKEEFGICCDDNGRRRKGETFLPQPNR